MSIILFPLFLNPLMRTLISGISAGLKKHEEATRGARHRKTNVLDSIVRIFSAILIKNPFI